MQFCYQKKLQGIQNQHLSLKIIIQQIHRKVKVEHKNYFSFLRVIDFDPYQQKSQRKCLHLPQCVQNYSPSYYLQSYTLQTVTTNKSHFAIEVFYLLPLPTGPQCYEINDFTFNNKFKNDLMEKFNTTTILRIHQLKLSQANYLKLFSHPFPKLKKLIFSNHQLQSVRKQNQISNVLTPKIVKKIFTSKFFTHLEELDMARTHLQFKHFQFLQDQEIEITSNLRILYLISNFLQERAFKLLSKIDFQGKLEVLGLAENSLISNKTIDYILKIIESPTQEKSQLRNITLYDAAISTDNLIRLLKNIDTSKMVNLNIGSNALQHSKSFKIPFNNTFFKFLSKCDFRALKRLSLPEMDLDDQQLPYLKNLVLPSLINLDLQRNFITDDYFSQWIIKEKIPKLRRLSINENNITDHAIQLLVKQNYENFTALSINNNRRLTSAHLIHLSKLNTSKLTRLQMSHNTMFEKDMRIFFSKPFENLQHLDMISVLDGYDFFEFANWRSMKNLKYLNLVQTDFSSSIDLIHKNNVTFPNLKIFKFGGLWITHEYISEMLKDLIPFGPILELVHFMESRLNPYTVYFNLSQIKSKTIPSGMYLRSTCLSIYKSPKTQRLQIIDVILGDEEGNNLYATMFNYSFFGNYQQSQPYYQLFYYNVTQVSIVLSYLKLCADWYNVQKFYMYQLDDIDIFLGLYFYESDALIKIYYNEYYNFVKYHNDFPSSIVFPYLKDINYIPSQQSQLPNQPKFLYYLNKMISPLLNTVQLGQQMDQSFPYLVNKYLKSNKNIKNLYIIASSIDCTIFDKIFNGVKLPFLTQILFQQNQIEISCFSKFISNHTSIKVMYISANFMQRGLFDKVIAQNNLILKVIDISYMQIGNEQFAKMAKINLQFMQSIIAMTININTEGIKWFVGNNTAQKLLPRCSSINFANNFINENGVGLLLSTGMPFINDIKLHHVNNPNLFNEMFSYPNSFEVISIQDANIYGIDKSLDKRSTRHVRVLQLKSPTLTLEDFQMLSNMDFLNLMEVLLFIENIYQCEVLKYILKIVQNADVLTLVLINEKNKYKMLDDKCLKPNDPKEIYMKHLNVFNIMWQGELAYTPKFYTYFYSKDQLVSGLILGDSLIGDEVLIEIVQNCNLQHLWIAVLANNLLTDSSVRKLLQLPLLQLKSLFLLQNEFTQKSLQPLQNKVFYELYQIDMSQNPIGDQGVEYLTRAKFPRLMVLSLTNCDITKQGLKKLMKLNAPQLTQISLVNNLFDQYDFIEFVEEFQFEKFPYLSHIGTSIRMNELNKRRIQSIVSKKLTKQQITITYDEYRLTMDNKAQI